MKLNYEINLEEAENKIDSAGSAIDAVVYLITLVYQIISGKWLAEIIKSYLN